MIYEEDTEILVLFPLPEEESGPRDNWSWLPGIVVSVCDDEYQILVQDERLAELEHGEITYPLCFRDASEIRPVRLRVRDYLRNTGGCLTGLANTSSNNPNL